MAKGSYEAHEAVKCVCCGKVVHREKAVLLDGHYYGPACARRAYASSLESVEEYMQTNLAWKDDE